MDSVSFFPSLLKMLAALTVVLGLMIGAMYILKRFLLQTNPGMEDGPAIRIMATRYVGPKNSIMLIDVLGQFIVIGLSNQQMSLLTTISDSRAVESLRGQQVNLKKVPAVMEQLTKYKDVLLMMTGPRKGSPEK